MSVRTTTVRGITMPHLNCLHGEWREPPPIAPLPVPDGPRRAVGRNGGFKWTGEILAFAIKRDSEGVLHRVIADEINERWPQSNPADRNMVCNKINRAIQKGLYKRNSRR